MKNNTGKYNVEMNPEKWVRVRKGEEKKSSRKKIIVRKILENAKEILWYKIESKDLMYIYIYIAS